MAPRRIPSFVGIAISVEHYLSKVQLTNNPLVISYYLQKSSKQTNFSFKQTEPLQVKTWSDPINNSWRTYAISE